MSHPEGFASDQPERDGRRLRAQRSRAKMLDALEAVIRVRGDELSAEAVAAEAGLSISTVFRHFGDVEHLRAAMNERIGQRVLPWLEKGPFEGDYPARLAELLDRRCTIFELIGPFWRAGRIDSGGSDVARSGERMGEQAFEAQAHAALGPEFEAAPEVADAVLTLLSLESWHHLRNARGLDADAARARLQHAVTRLLCGNPRSG